ncbi:ral guanine nucleotide dissociation stimulator-like 1 [Columba livia]|uniref:ral guanine nucleotide dissociation stimulator-like 1 n=1 Tax=Columba livia TaxID=8932 RepID=UPI0031BAFC2B
MLMFEELSEIFSDSDNFATSRELLLKGVTQGTVPYLGTFLTDLVMLDTALQDYLEGGLINFEKRRRVSGTLTVLWSLVADALC